MMGNKQVLKGGDEWDVVTGWRKVLKSMGRPGKKKEVRKRLSKRARKEAKDEIKKQVEGKSSIHHIDF